MTRKSTPSTRRARPAAPSSRASRGRATPAELGARLDALVRATDHAARRESDPVGFVHRYRSADDREVVGLIAALLAFGNVLAIRRSIARVLAVLDPSPAATIDRAAPGELSRALDGFAHRVWVGADVAALLEHAASLRRAHGSLAAAFVAHRAAAPTFIEALARFADALRGPSPSPGLKHLVPDPRRGSACKRLLLYLRWMVRPADGVDLGLFDVSPAELVIPVDTHVQRIARNLRLTERRDASLRTATEITAALAALDADDPVRYDFALCHLGISRACPSRRSPALCERCVVKDVCRHWR